MRLPLILAMAALFLLLLSGLGVRADLWPFRTGFTLLRIAAWGGLIAAICAVVLVWPKREDRRAVLGLVAAAAIGSLVAFVPWRQLQQARALPMIHDISTDLDDPPAFVAIAPLRAGAPNPAAWAGDETAQAQRQAYPAIVPLQLNTTPDTAFARARALIEHRGWTLVAADSATGRLEATATTFWFGFKDDVVLRLRATPDGGTRVDMRSKSRLGKSDVGANARRIAAFLQDLARAD